MVVQPLSAAAVSAAWCPLADGPQGVAGSWHASAGGPPGPPGRTFLHCLRGPPPMPGIPTPPPAHPAARQCLLSAAGGMGVGGAGRPRHREPAARAAVFRGGHRAGRAGGSVCDVGGGRFEAHARTGAAVLRRRPYCGDRARRVGRSIRGFGSGLFGARVRRCPDRRVGGASLPLHPWRLHRPFRGPPPLLLTPLRPRNSTPPFPSSRTSLLPHPWRRSRSLRRPPPLLALPLRLLASAQPPHVACRSTRPPRPVWGASPRRSPPRPAWGSRPRRA